MTISEPTTFFTDMSCRARRDRASLFIVLGVITSVAGAVVQRSGFDLHRNFNHNDLFHVVQIGANYLFYRGALRLSDWGRAPAEIFSPPR
jgi:hypothetical protein